MLNQLENLSREVDGRYASDAELQFLEDYMRSFHLRMQTYQKLQELEVTMVQQAYVKMRSADASIFAGNNREETNRKCQRDMVGSLRATALTVLLDDPDAHQERFLLWLQSMMRSLGKEQTCNQLYTAYQELAKQHLSPAQAELVCPILELNRRMTGTNP
ncbi:MAG: phycobilisome protein [Oculatellaceae cyanobacterium Prado106]|jgi:hypothetical protein|nr:phycobilisome protein [Oculatellaceae cyanobacterium Prado106]